MRIYILLHEPEFSTVTSRMALLNKHTYINIFNHKQHGAV
jgi:hypothetical protein